MLARTTSGGVTVNDVVFHVAQEELPFGGVGPSGMGSYHGIDGFREFSHRKAVYRQMKRRHRTPWMLRPPYGTAIARFLATQISVRVKVESAVPRTGPEMTARQIDDPAATLVSGQCRPGDRSPRHRPGRQFPLQADRWVIPFAPGGNYDVTSRLVAEPMGRQLGQNVLIDNKPGAGGVVGLDAAVNAPADGYTIVMASFTVGYVAPIFAGKQQMLQVLAPVSILTTSPTLIVRGPTAASPTSRRCWPRRRPSRAR